MVTQDEQVKAVEGVVGSIAGIMSGAIMIAIITGLLIAAFGAWQIFFGNSATKGWVNATGTVTGEGIQTYSIGGGKAPEYIPNITYTYTYAGISYSGKWSGSTATVNPYTYSNAQLTVQQHPVGSGILLVLDPTNPSSSKPLYGLNYTSSNSVYTLVFGVLFALVGFGMRSFVGKFAKNV